ncbi:tripartite tricarboxylate transporter TctB family protein [Ramlibacter sp. AN1015]|uniref:tripartite tricarboxylate transporter TctB family protein n=1 Tax=Ramlibacter sp. AN1015 TaxID=3133428 RepID=UPI0030C0F917
MESGSRIRNQKDFAAGVIYVAAGSAFGLGAFNYNIGDASRMGPGWFPMAVGGLLVVVGIFTLLSSLSRKAVAEQLRRPHIPSILWILSSVVLFGVLLYPAGLVVSLFVLVMVSSMASHEFKWWVAAINGVVLVSFSIAVFIWGIDLLIPLWPAFMR